MSSLPPFKTTGILSAFEAKAKTQRDTKLTLSFLADTYEFGSSYTSGMQIPKGEKGALHTVPAKELFGNFTKWFDPIYAIVKLANESPRSLADAKAKEPEKVIDLFQERFEEDAHAYYDTPQSLKQGQLEFFLRDVNDPDNELVEWKGDELYFVIEENRKLAFLRKIQFYNKKTKLYSGYPIKYRLNKEGGMGDNQVVRWTSSFVFKVAPSEFLVSRATISKKL